MILRSLLLALALLWPLTQAGAASLTFGPGASDTERPIDGIVAVVDDDVITATELREAMAVVRGQIVGRGATPPDEETLRRQVLERLVLTQLQLRAAERNGVVVDDATVNGALENIAAQNGLSLDQLREALAKDGVSMTRFREDIRREILSVRLRQKVVDSRLQVSEQEVRNMLATARSASGEREYRLGHLLIALPENASAEQLAEAEKRAAELLQRLRGGEDFARVAMAHSDGRQALEGGDLGWLAPQNIPTLFAEVVPRLNVGELSDVIRSPSGLHIVKLLEAKGAASQLVTQTRARHILLRLDELLGDEEAELRLQRLRERILAGEDFAELARTNSQDTGSAVRGGDLGWVNPGATVPAFEDAMNALAPGEVSPPVRSPFGWHLIQVLERRQHDGGDELEQARAANALRKRKGDEEWDQWLRRLREEAYVELRL